MDDLHRHLAPDPRIPRAVDLAHATGADLADDLVVGEGLADHPPSEELINSNENTSGFPVFVGISMWRGGGDRNRRLTECEKPKITAICMWRLCVEGWLKGVRYGGLTL